MFQDHQTSFHSYVSDNNCFIKQNNGKYFYNKIYYNCDTCRHKYKYKRSLQHHQRYECGKEPQFKCPYCELSCHQKGTLKTHMLRKHKHLFYN